LNYDTNRKEANKTEPPTLATRDLGIALMGKWVCIWDV
jgi:hypothetical protein